MTELIAGIYVTDVNIVTGKMIVNGQRTAS